MKKLLQLTTALGVSILTAAIAAPAGAQSLTGLTSGNRVFYMNDPNNPVSVTASHLISGVAPGSELTAIQYQPGSGQLYGVAYNRVDATAQMYLISTDQYTASPLGAALESLQWGANPQLGFDFDPADPNSVYITTADGRYRINVEDGSRSENLSNPFSTGVKPRQVLSASYSTNAAYGVNGNTVYGYDPAHRTLSTYNVNTQTVRSIVLPGSGFSAGTAMGMDVLYNNSTQGASGYIATSANGNVPGALYQVNFTNGEVERVGTIGGGNLAIRDITISQTRITSKGDAPSSGSYQTEAASVYPNPAISYTNVLLSEPAQQKVYIYIVNLNGQVQQSLAFDPGGNNYFIDVSSLPAGLYSMQVQESGKRPVSLKLSKAN